MNASDYIAAYAFFIGLASGIAVTLVICAMNSRRTKTPEDEHHVGDGAWMWRDSP